MSLESYETGNVVAAQLIIIHDPGKYLRTAVAAGR
jgi:hypothetical protein